MLIVDRTHPLANDLDWAPAPLKRRNWLHRLRTPGELLRGWVDGVWEPDYDEPLIRERIDELRAALVAPADLANAPEGALVAVSGRIVAGGEIDGVLVKKRGVARRLAFRTRRTWMIHEALIDFGLADDAGRVIPVRVAQARLLVSLGDPLDYTTTDFIHDAVPAGIRACFQHGREAPTVQAVERVVEEGETVTIVGRRTTDGDPAADGYRDAPSTLALEGRAELPLLILPAR